MSLNFFPIVTALFSYPSKGKQRFVFLSWCLESLTGIEPLTSPKRREGGTLPLELWRLRLMASKAAVRHHVHISRTSWELTVWKMPMPVTGRLSHLCLEINHLVMFYFFALFCCIQVTGPFHWRMLTVMSMNWAPYWFILTSEVLW